MLCFVNSHHVLNQCRAECIFQKYSRPKPNSVVEFQRKQNFISENATYFLCCQVLAAKVPWWMRFAEKWSSSLWPTKIHWQNIPTMQLPSNMFGAFWSLVYPQTVWKYKTIRYIVKVMSYLEIRFKKNTKIYCVNKRRFTNYSNWQMMILLSLKRAVTYLHMLNFCDDYSTLTTALGPRAGWGGYLSGRALEVPTEEKIYSFPRIWR